MLWTFEMTKVVRSRRLVVAGGTILLFLVLMLLGFYTYAQTETGGQVEFRYTYENKSYFNGLTFALYAFYFAILMIVPIFAAAEGGSQIAGEAHSGTLQLLLSPLKFLDLAIGRIPGADGVASSLFFYGRKRLEEE